MICVHFQPSTTCQTGIPVSTHNFWKKSLSEDQSHLQSILTSLLLAVSLPVCKTSPDKNHVCGQNSFTNIQRLTPRFLLSNLCQDNNLSFNHYYVEREREREGGGESNSKHKRSASHHSKMLTNWEMMLCAAQ
jgi:hypothetical protein